MQSSPFLQTQAAPAVHVFVEVGPASGTEPFEPDDAPLELDDPLDPADPEELVPVSSPSLEHAAATTTTRPTTTTAADRATSERVEFTPQGYEALGRVSTPFGEQPAAGGVMELCGECR